ncbi:MULTISPECIES: GNAT family N-acetyltransferase [unclassified Mesorhizobium]|uniref:GNAT family N-acetyltransferase n=1 Tax=Mesorhizobium TaxID=68287 RepID=UPI000A065DF9|nr:MULTISPECIES: GNAT family N-acetyltransferase [unclassified Mesorhizobium]
MTRSKQVSDWACSASGAARKPDLLIELVETGGDAKAEAGAALYRYNVAKSGVADRMPIGAIVRDASGKVVGGLWGRTELGLLFLDMFFLTEDVRGKSYGSRLLSAVETEARKRGCARAVVETSSFQAPGFYVRHGYEEFGRVEFGIPGTARIFLRKEL